MSSPSTSGRGRCTSVAIVLALLGVALPVSGGTGPAPSVDLDVDTDRDGRITPADEVGEARWSAHRGAMFVANLDDDDGDGAMDGPILDAEGRLLGADRMVNGPSDVADLAPVDIRVVAVPGAVLRSLTLEAIGDATGFQVHSARSADAVAILGGPDGPTTATVTAPARLAIEGLALRWSHPGAHDAFPAGWDGVATLRATATFSDGTVAADVVQLRVAPIIFPSVLDPATSVLERAADHLIPGSTSVDAPNQWIQDHVEWARHDAPGLDGLDVVLRMPYARPTMPAWPEEFLGPDIGWYSLGSDLGGGSGDAGGNLEVVPAHDGHPLGRILVGSTMSDALYGFLSDQEVQTPYPKQTIDTSWLAVGHVDELVSFVPSPDGWSLVVADLKTVVPGADIGGPTDGPVGVPGDGPGVVQDGRWTRIGYEDGPCVAIGKRGPDDDSRPGRIPNPPCDLLTVRRAESARRDVAPEDGVFSGFAKRALVLVSSDEGIEKRAGIVNERRIGVDAGERRILVADEGRVDARRSDDRGGSGLASKIVYNSWQDTGVRRAEGRAWAESAGRAMLRVADDDFDDGSRTGGIRWDAWTTRSDDGRVEGRTDGRMFHRSDDAVLGRAGVRVMFEVERRIGDGAPEVDARRAEVAVRAFDAVVRCDLVRARACVAIDGGPPTVGPPSDIATPLIAALGPDTQVIEIVVPMAASPVGWVAARPNLVNLVHVDGVTYLPSHQDGLLPADDHEAAAAQALPGPVRFVDDIDAYHRLGGELHCGTYVVREVSNDWWQHV